MGGKAFGATLVTPLNLLRTVQTIRLPGISGLKGRSMSPLRHARLVDLSGTDVDDVSALGDVPLLNLSWCHGLSSVAGLGRNRELDLSRCGRLKDVASLGGVRKLSLAWTPVSDVSALGRVHALDLGHCENITCFDALGGNYFLDLTGTNIGEISHLGSVHTLVLMCCANARVDYFARVTNTILRTAPTSLEFGHRYFCKGSALLQVDRYSRIPTLRFAWAN